MQDQKTHCICTPSLLQIWEEKRKNKQHTMNVQVCWDCNNPCPLATLAHAQGVLVSEGSVSRGGKEKKCGVYLVCFLAHEWGWGGVNPAAQPPVCAWTRWVQMEGGLVPALPCVILHLCARLHVSGSEGVIQECGIPSCMPHCVHMNEGGTTQGGACPHIVLCEHRQRRQRGETESAYHPCSFPCSHGSEGPKLRVQWGVQPGTLHTVDEWQAGGTILTTNLSKWHETVSFSVGEHAERHRKVKMQREKKC
jgi:hypothetical protein